MADGGYKEMQEMVPEVSKKLKTCPFCNQGVYLRMVEYRRHGAHPRFFVNHRRPASKSCPYSRSSNHLSFEHPLQALRCWNNRAEEA